MDAVTEDPGPDEASRAEAAAAHARLAAAGALRLVAGAQAAAARRHARSAVAGLAGAVTLGALLVAARRDAAFAAAHPGSITLDGALVALLLVLAGSALAQAVFALRAGRLAGRAAAPVTCTVQRLAAATRMRRDYLLVHAEGAPAPVLVRCGREAGLARLPERCAGALVGGRRAGPVIVATPDLPPMVARAGRYERLLPRNLRADWVHAAAAGRPRAGTD